MLSLDATTGTAFSVHTTTGGGANPYGLLYGVPLLIGNAGAVSMVLQAQLTYG